jgi:RNA polymerase primary sigma factor
LSPLNPLLKVAVLAGAEPAVRAHIERGDDLDARDATGLTALMIAASKNKASICSLLIASGADHALIDSSGRTALAIAKAVGAAQAASAIEFFLPKAAEPSVARDQIRPALRNRNNRPEDGLRPRNGEQKDGQSPFDLSGWDAEEEPLLAESESSLADVAGKGQRALSGHRPVDDSEDWHDVEVLLPERAAPLRQGADDERRARLRTLLLQGLRDGTVPAQKVIAVCESADGIRDEDAERLLQFVLGELGAEVNEWWEIREQGSDDESESEELVVVEALEFLDHLTASRDEPARYTIGTCPVRRSSLPLRKSCWAVKWRRERPPPSLRSRRGQRVLRRC